MPREQELRQAALNVLQSMSLTQWDVATHRKTSDDDIEALSSSLIVVVTEQTSFNYRPPFIEVTLTSENPEGNITNVSYSYGFTFGNAGNFSIDAALNQDVWDRHGETAMRGASWMVQQLNLEAEMNSQTSRAFEFMSKLIQLLSTRSHPEV
ncbi:hypothetical protein VB774_07325 [Pseudanabaena galeata UHCC 0370]|uniref:Uncharacterized protein n=1 Tax=Pseudanabaena galeata UHCC 0370 TaxID=3110310 RepID=A0ABU5TGL9_9CYAN|nr:hypothetical protein [Pseudanabaena galeata]MEA5477428.1 hypothetical protein [Pseudanabaena galeata UHCC 0370]